MQIPSAESKLAASMPAKYVELRAGQSALSKEAADTVPERIEGALAPNFLNVPGRLIKVHLPDADIRYFSRLYSEEESAFFMKKLNSDKSDNKWDKLGKGRFVAQWSRPAGQRYVFSQDQYVAGSFPDFAEKIRLKVIEVLKPIYGEKMTDFNYCVCNCYLNGMAGVNWHSDSEPHLVPGYPIACVSFGSERVFSLAKISRNVTQQVRRADLNLRLESGSMVVMAGDTQRHYLHAISKEGSVKNVRFSLTFRVNFIDDHLP